VDAVAVYAGIGCTCIAVIAVDGCEGANAIVASVCCAGIAIITIECDELAGAVNWVAYINCAEVVVIAAGRDMQTDATVAHIFGTFIRIIAIRNALAAIRNCSILASSCSIAEIGSAGIAVIAVNRLVKATAIDTQIIGAGIAIAAINRNV